MAYQIHPFKERPEALYAIIETAKRRDITLEMVMKAGEELGEMEEFLRLWVAYLGPRTSASAQRLLKEAVELLNDPAQLLENARTFHEQHPALYEQYLSENPGKLEAAELFAIGQEALEVIGTNYVIRSRIALQLSQMALQMGNGAEEQCWLEAFRSDTRVVNYLAWIEMLIERRVRGIMEANRRKHYGECAGFIAALGEVRESRGELCGKQNVMMEYKAMYSRRSAFHGELAAYGMKDSRKR